LIEARRDLKKIHSLEGTLVQIQRLYERSSFAKAYHSRTSLLGVVKMSLRTILAFKGITVAIFRKLRKKASRNGFRVRSASGEALKDGVTIRWKYDRDSELLEVGCVHAPFWIDAGRVNKKLTEEIEATLASRKAA
jgi:hypothetical protein